MVFAPKPVQAHSPHHSGDKAKAEMIVQELRLELLSQLLEEVNAAKAAAEMTAEDCESGVQ